MPNVWPYTALLATGLPFLSSEYQTIIFFNQSTQTLQRSTEFILFLWVGNPKIAFKGGYLGLLCKLFGKFWSERGSCDLPMCLQIGWVFI
jgi:hypothetical protein